MGKVAAALGMGTKLTHKGVEYTLSPWTYEVQGKFERYLEDYVLQVHRRMKPYMSEDEYRDELKKIRWEIASGEYTFGGDNVAKALGALPHLTHLLYLMLKGAHPEATPALAAEIVEGQMEEVMAKMADANADPSTETTEMTQPTA